MLQEIFLLGTIVINLSLIVLLLFQFPRLRKIGKEEKDAGEILSAIISEIRNRMYAQDERISDLQVRMDVAEVRLTRGTEVKAPVGRTVGLTISDDVFGKHVGLQRAVASPQISHITKLVEGVGDEGLERRILEFVSAGPKTSREVEVLIGRSREHTSRLMKKLYDRHLVERDESKKPFRYKLSEQLSG